MFKSGTGMGSGQNVIGDSTGAITLTIDVSRNSGEIGVKRRANRCVENWRAILRAQDDVNEHE